MTKIQKGNLCELLVLTRLIKSGYAIAMPYGKKRGWNLLVEVQNKWQKWLIKSVYSRGCRGFRYVDCIIKTRNRSCRYEQDEFDYLIAVDPDSGEMWAFHFDEAIGRRCIAVDDVKPLSI